MIACIFIIILSSLVSTRPSELDHIERFLMEDEHYSRNLPPTQDNFDTNLQSWQDELVSSAGVVSDDLSAIASSSMRSDIGDVHLIDRLEADRHWNKKVQIQRHKSEQARTHDKCDRFEPDVRAMMKSLMDDHGLSMTSVYRYTNQGMKGGIIHDLDEFKRICIEKAKCNNAIWGKEPRSRRKKKQEEDQDWKQGQSQADDVMNIDELEARLDLFTEEASEPGQSMEGTSSHDFQQSTLPDIDSRRRCQERYKVRSKSDKRWLYTKEALTILEEFKNYGMARETARIYLEKGIKSGDIDNLDRFKSDVHVKYLKEGVMRGRTGRRKKDLN